MRTFFTATLILLLSTPAVMAKTCQDKFIDLITNVYSNKGSSKIYITQDGKGIMKSKNYHYSDGKGHSMTEMIEPKNMAWTLFYKDAGYSSPDHGKSWKKTFEYNSKEQTKNTEKTLRKDAKTARNMTCSKEDIQGVAHETIEGVYTSNALKAEMHDKFWVNEKTGWISKKISRMKGKYGNGTTVQIIEPAPDLKLPVPH